MWISENEGAKFWLAVCTELRNRGMKDCSIACVDGLTGFPEAIETIFPQTQVQLCLVHMVRNALKYVNDKQRAEVAKELKMMDSAATETEAEFNLELFAEKWDQQYPTISTSWRAHWTRIIPLFSYPEEIRKGIDTTNAIESVTMTLRKVTRKHRIFPSDDAVSKGLYLAIQNITKKWSTPIFDWKAAFNYFSIAFAERFPQ
jgi:putative transposase